MHTAILRIFKEFPPKHYKMALHIIAEYADSFEISAVVDGDTLVKVNIAGRNWLQFARVLNRNYAEISLPGGTQCIR